MIFLLWEQQGNRPRFPLFAQISTRVPNEAANGEATNRTSGGRTRFRRFTVSITATNRLGDFLILISHEVDVMPRVVAFTQARGLISLMFRTPSREAETPMDTDGAARTRPNQGETRPTPGGTTTRPRGASTRMTTSQRTMRLLRPTHGAMYGEVPHRQTHRGVPRQQGQRGASRTGPNDDPRVLQMPPPTLPTHMQMHTAVNPSQMPWIIWPPPSNR